MTNDEMASALRKSGWTVEPPITPENCAHRQAMGSGGMNGDGSGYYHWRCPVCKAQRSVTWPPTPYLPYENR